MAKDTSGRRFRQVALVQKESAWRRLRALGICRMVFVGFFVLFYGLFLGFFVFGNADPHQRHRFEQQESEEAALSLMMGPPDPVRSEMMKYQPVSAEHWLGTDQRGRDLFTRLSYGAWTSLVTGCIGLVTFLLAGISFGVASGYFKGRWRSVIIYLFNLVNTFPILLLLFLAVIVIDRLFEDELSMRIYMLMAVFGFFSSPKLAELIRGKIASLKETAFINAAVSLGLSPVQIIFKHILWYECRPIILVQSAYMMGQAILVETTLTYLNFGLEDPLISWGLMLRTMAGGISTGKFQVLVVMAVIAFSVFFFHNLAALLNDLLASRQRDVD
jgi:peptide/nickel transport system permease protein